MEKLKIEGTYQIIWDKLREQLKENKEECAGGIIVSFINSLEVKDLLPLKQIVLENTDLNFEIEYRFLLPSKSNVWETEIKSNYEKMRGLISNLRLPDYSKIKLRFFFEVNRSVNFKEFEIINQIFDSYKARKQSEFFFCCLKSIKLEENTRKGWGKIWNAIKQLKLNIQKSGQKIIYNCKVFYKATNDDDVTKFRYFLPLWHNCHKTNVKLSLFLSIDDKKDEDIFYSFIQFFSFIQKHIREDIFINNITLKYCLKKITQRQSSEVLPVLIFNEKQDPENLIDNYTNIFESYIAFICNEKKYVSPNDDETIMSNSNRIYLRNKLFAIVFEKIFPLQIQKATDIIEIYVIEESIRYLNSAQKEIQKNKYPKKDKLIEIIKNFKSDKDKEQLISNLIKTLNGKLNDADKEQLVLILLKILNEKLYSQIINEKKNQYQEEINKLSNKLTALIFLFLIKNLIDNRTVFRKEKYKEENKIKERYELNEYVIDKTWMDSKTYSEGFGQLIENAQLHSEGHTAYFAMRIYYANPNGSMSNLSDVIKRRQNLYKEYWRTEAEIREKDNKINTTNSNNIFNLKDNNGKIVFSSFIEFFILDDAISENGECLGILDSILKKSEKSQKIKKGEIVKLWSLMELNEDSYENPNDKESHYIEHYGMRWFEQHIRNLNGIFKIFSPYNTSKKLKICEVECSNIFKDDVKIPKEEDINYYKNLYSTEYSVLVPISHNYFDLNLDIKVQNDNDNNYFIPPQEYKELCSSFHSILQTISENDLNKLNLNDKLDSIEKIAVNHLKTISDKSKNIFLEMNAELISIDKQVEIIAKVIFKLIYNLHKDTQDNKLFFAIIFGKNKDLVKEFIRIFAIFYKNGDNKYMKNVQVAICSNSNDSLKEVNFIIAGESIASAYLTAKNFLYFDAEASLEFLPELKFLSRSISLKKQKEHEKLKIFPFDLYLEDKESELNNSNRLEQTWFEKKMLLRLKTDVRKCEYGCKLSDIMVRLGSKINIDTFYEAELLFHNLGIIKRFAYLIALDIINNQDLKSCQYIFLVGYENYSAILIQEIHFLLEKHYKNIKKMEINWIIDTCAEDFPVLSFDGYTTSEKKEIKDAIEKDKVACVIILPLGSTMSTIYKLQNSFRRGLKKELKVSNETFEKFYNYCILGIGDIFEKIKIANENQTKNAQKNALEPYKKYINFKESIKLLKNNTYKDFTQIILTKEKNFESSENKHGITVKLLLCLGAKWIPAEEPKKYKDEKPLLHVDKTSTLLETYFQTPLQEEVLNYYQKKSKVGMLQPENGKNYIKYGHIVRGDNHYQFYFDFAKLTKDKSSKIEKTAKQWKNNINFNDYNIIISPLQSTNASFLKIILDNTFDNNLHLLHINIQDTGKENIRTKFEYIAYEMKRIRIQQDKKICFYYIDDTICTGNGIKRAYKFLQVMCNQYGIKAPEKFAKVFLLLNRSSYETAETWVENPNEDWCGFINLCVPSYNTHLEKNAIMCPGCRIKERFELLRKRSATNELCNYFLKHIEKHKARNQNEYDLWLEERIMDDFSYLEWLYEYTYYKAKNRHKIIINLKNLSNEDKLLWVNEIIYIENYRRLKSMDNAYRKLLYDKDLQIIYEESRTSNNFESFKKKLKETILVLLLKSLNKNNDYDKTFEFISYIKVISRDYLGKNYFIKESIFSILKELFKFLIENETKNFSDNRILEIVNKIKALPAVFQYRILKIIIHRLALMRSESIIEMDNIQLVIKKYNFLLEKSKSEALSFISTNINSMWISYLASIKIATMEENNDNICNVLCNEAKKLSKKQVLINENIQTPLYNYLFFENTRVLYDFIDELRNCSENLNNEDNKYKGYNGKGSLSERKEKLKNLTKEVVKRIKECYESDKILLYRNPFLYQNPFHSYLTFYTNIFNVDFSSSNDAIKKEYEKLTEMLNYFNVLKYLTEPEFEGQRKEQIDSLPYIFEDMCISIKNMTEAKSCYLVYKSKGEVSQLISRSGYFIDIESNNGAFPIDEKENMFSSLRIGSMEFDLLIKSINEKIEIQDYKIASTNDSLIQMMKCIKVIEQKKLKNLFLLFDFPFLGNAQRHFYIILELKKDASKLSKMALRVLFLRNRLCEAVEKYYSSILTLRFHCNYIQSVIESTKENLKIMHLTDLHLKDDESWLNTNEKWGFLKKKLESFAHKIDLLAITGDIVDHSEDSATAQKKYKRAANLLFEIAKVLWSVEGTLPHDWKRRILITTGNHDYAAMNEMKIFTESRKIATGMPGNQLGGTMAKYAYYIEFLSYFLDAPTQRLLKNDLNEVREYDKLGLIIGIFNSCSKANALQTNKVSFNQEKLELVLKDSSWKKSNKNHFVLVHHDSTYSEELNYFNDKYSLWKWKYKDKDRIYNAYIKALEAEVKRTITKNEFDVNALGDFINEYKKIPIENPEITDTEIFRDIQMLFSIVNKNIESNEYVKQFLSTANILFETTEEDKKNMRNSYNAIANFNDDKKCFIIAGHTHEQKEKQDSNGKLKNYIGAQFEKDNKETRILNINFEIIYNNENLNPEIHSIEKKDKFRIYNCPRKKRYNKKLRVKYKIL